MACCARCMKVTRAREKEEILYSSVTLGLDNLPLVSVDCGGVY